MQGVRSAAWLTWSRFLTSGAIDDYKARETQYKLGRDRNGNH
jgi:hypothetical protein